ncbi:MAG: S-layer homology domain-containing protein, partial [Clostridia bacterium]|nr:S-layer homology domain-containing protein [Clostridia bacterium]
KTGLMANDNLTATTYSIGGMGTAQVKSEGNVLAVIKINLSEANDAPFYVSLVDGATLTEDTATISVKKGTLPAAWVEVPVYGDVVDPTPTPKPVGSVTLPEVGITTDDVPADAAENDKLFIAVEVTKKDGSEAVYGVDYAATVGDKTLTEDEFNNVINGYFDLVDGVDSWEDVINNMKLDVYNTGTTVSAQLIQQTDEGDEVVAIGYKTVGTVKPTPEPDGPSISVTPKSKTVNTGVKVTVKAEVKNPVEGGILSASYDVAALDLVTGSGIVISDDATTVTFTGAVKGKVVITYTYTDADGNPLADEAKSTITIKEKTESTGGGSGSSLSTGNDGPIANGNVNTGVVGTLPGMTKFNDLGDVAWAQEAITKLAAMGAISGRDANTFDPNANITRAEYCQILVNAIGKSQEAADCNFDDVATDAWYYHSVAVASSYGIVSGYGDGNFGPNNLITRRDMALMTMKAAQVEGVNLSAIRTLTFADAAQFEYAADAVNTLANAGIINGMSETEFAPLANATRAQAAKIIYDTFVK